MNTLSDLAHKTNLDTLLPLIVQHHQLHSRWLNTLSLMENVGARKIAAAEHPRNVDLLMLKHAAEEARHAYYLKKQLSKIPEADCPDYSDVYLLAPRASYHYLHALDVAISRYLKTTLACADYQLRYMAYLLVTYAIEVRADELYPAYQEALSAAGSKVNVKSIIVEEEGHLAEMQTQMEAVLPNWQQHAKAVTDIEAGLYEKWVANIAQTVQATLN
ncbi:hypothetical protein [Eisenibacter elegans]|jgi:hypothetical protein|uniref:hypothetical protein n=1 Tax=Eisenibacter elegans TaxID=997 RepID=UPI0004284EF0|nr:hypothetical protein [Eisenibacter elegans]